MIKIAPSPSSGWEGAITIYEKIKRDIQKSKEISADEASDWNQKSKCRLDFLFSGFDKIKSYDECQELMMHQLGCTDYRREPAVSLYTRILFHGQGCAVV